MRHKRLILILALLIISIIYIIHPYTIEKSKQANGYKESIIRFHVKANSDRDEDQILKLKVRDEILKETKEKFDKSKSIEDTRAIVEANLDNMESIAKRVVEKEGMDLPVAVYFGPKNFPTRSYGNVTFPAGEYETLQVSIGQGQGKNWWCVMFPPLCFVEMGQGNLGNPEGELRETLAEEDVDFILTEKEPPIVLKSKIIEIIERTRVYFAKDLP